MIHRRGDIVWPSCLHLWRGRLVIHSWRDNRVMPISIRICGRDRIRGWHWIPPIYPVRLTVNQNVIFISLLFWIMTHYRWSAWIVAVFGCIFVDVIVISVTAFAARFAHTCRPFARRFRSFKRVSTGCPRQIGHLGRISAHETRSDGCVARQPAIRLVYQGWRHQRKGACVFKMRLNLLVLIFPQIFYCHLGLLRVSKDPLFRLWLLVAQLQTMSPYRLHEMLHQGNCQPRHNESTKWTLFLFDFYRWESRLTSLIRSTYRKCRGMGSTLINWNNHLSSLRLLSSRRSSWNCLTSASVRRTVPITASVRNRRRRRPCSAVTARSDASKHWRSLRRHFCIKLFHVINRCRPTIRPSGEFLFSFLPSN